MTVPSPINNVWLPARNDGRNAVFLDRSTTTWNVPLAASYLLSAVIDFSSGGLPRTVVVSANGLRNCGSSRTADSTSSNTTTVAIAATTMMARRNVWLGLGNRITVAPVQIGR